MPLLQELDVILFPHLAHQRSAKRANKLEALAVRGAQLLRSRACRQEVAFMNHRLK